LAALVAKDYAEAFLTLLVIYRDISASEAAARLNIHIKTAQDFLVGLEEAGILEKREAAEGKRPYFRYCLKEKTIHITMDLDALYDPKARTSVAGFKIKECKNSGAIFKEGRNERIASFSVFKGSGRSREERRYRLTERQGRFLFHLPFPTEAAASVEDIMNKAGVERDDLPEILDLIDILTEHKIIEKRAG
ncbi:MAG: hypothetical protein KJ874_03935, partial [Acidobacteria bacterium]|nr:hypothetical protein [Acidobacteriota bacterium]